MVSQYKTTRKIPSLIQKHSPDKVSALRDYKD